MGSWVRLVPLLRKNLVPGSVTSLSLAESGARLKREKTPCVTLAAEEASAPKHGQKRRVRVSAVLARKEFTREKSEQGETETKPTCFSSEGQRGVNLG